MGAGADPFAELEQQHQQVIAPPIVNDPFIELETAHAATKSGEIPAPSGTPKTRNTTWNPQHDVLENVSDQLEDVAGRVGRNIGDLAGGVVQKGKDVWHMLQHPSTLFNQKMDTPEEQIPALKDLPVVGPLSEGAPGAALGDIATGALLGKAGDLIPGKVGGLRPGETAPFTPKTPVANLLTPRTPEEVNFLKSSKPLTDIIDSDKGAGRFQDETLRKAMPIIQKEAKNYGDTGKIDSYDKLSALVDAARTKHVDQFNQYLDRARGLSIDRAREGVPQAMIDAIPQNIQTDAPALYQELKDQALAHGSPVKVETLDKIRMENNAMLKDFESSTGQDKASIMKAKASTAMLKAEQNATRDAIYRNIDPESGGKNVAEIQNRLGSLIEMRKGLDKLNDNMVRQSDPTMRQKVAKSVLDAAALKADPAVGASRLVLKKLMAEPDVNGKIKQAFGSYKGADLPDVPGPRTRLTLPPGATRVPPTDTTRVNITTGAPLEQNEPLTLHKTDPNTFEWQRNLFPEHREGQTFVRPYRPERPTLKSEPLRVKKPAKPISSNNASGTPPNVEDEVPYKY